MLKIVAIIIIAVIPCTAKITKEGKLVINKIFYIIIKAERNPDYKQTPDKNYNHKHCREVQYVGQYL